MKSAKRSSGAPSDPVTDKSAGSRTTRIHLDAVGGIAGDMFNAAILDARPDLFPFCIGAVGAIVGFYADLVGGTVQRGAFVRHTSGSAIQHFAMLVVGAVHVVARSTVAAATGSA